MYLCYTDESGDCGVYNEALPQKSGSRYFILVGLIVPSENWKTSLDVLKSFRKLIARQAYLPYDVEFHCYEMIDPHKIKAYSQISVKDRWKLIAGFANTIGIHGAFFIISVVIDKTISALNPDLYMAEAITKLYQAYDEFLRHQEKCGIILFDRANEKNITTHARRLLGTGSSGDTIPGIRIGWVIEDPMFKSSTESMFIQAADVIAYTLKEKEFPLAARKKFQADKIFQQNLYKRLFKSSLSDAGGIIRI
jgi:hypothetical protein